tara:strand:- start:87 stop:779 length:693 start_codon:yes stop_codon:yes gene_type:complete
MSKSKKNIIDPEEIVKNFGADAARLFILSDSPPEKDVQWSDEGIASSHKFIQKLWSLNLKIMQEISKNHKNDSSDKIEKYTNQYLKKMTDNLNSFSYNVLIAGLYEMYAFLNKEINKEYTKKTLVNNYSKILITLLPIIPHFTSECIEMNKFSMNLIWPAYDEKKLIEKTVKIVVQINGKKRGLIDIERDINQENLLKVIENNNGISKYLNNKKILKVIFVKNKIINIII